MSSVTIQIAGTGGGSTIPSAGTLNVGPGFSPFTLQAFANGNSVFTGWTGAGCTTGVLDTSAGVAYTCTATFNLAAPPPVAASVESDLALFLTFLGVIAITGFQRWRKRTES